jgi:thiamine-phosphate pyrophosphorylase
VTDRRKLRDAVTWRGTVRAFSALASEAADAGIALLQIRERDLDAALLSELVAVAVERTAASPTRVIVNDRLDVALSAGAAGVHLRGDSFSVGDVRRIAPAAFLIGASVHGLSDLSTRAVGADYVIAGTVFPTESKPDAERLLGLEALRRLVESTQQPVLAIGGVTRERARAVAATGAAGIAAIGVFLSGRPLAEVARELASAFDTGPHGS